MHNLTKKQILLIVIMSTLTSSIPFLMGLCLGKYIFTNWSWENLLLPFIFGTLGTTILIIDIFEIAFNLYDENRRNNG